MRQSGLVFRASITIALMCVLTIPDIARGIPPFARKYKTSCATCHVGFPKLTPFGEAFRINGFQWPEFGDADQVKEEPVELGSEGYKRVWPKAIWPNEIPGTAPVSFRIRQGAEVVSDSASSYFEFKQPAIQIMTGGSMGEDISFYAGAHLFEHGESGSIDRLYLKFDNMFANILPYNALYLRIGQFVPEIVPFITNHRGLTFTSFAFNTYAPANGESFAAGHVHGASAFGLESFQLGMEASGILKARLRYVLGMVNGNGVEEDNNAAKDIYYRLAFKLGGLAYDGSSEGDIYGPSGFNWAEKSLALATFGYFGKSGVDNLAIKRLGLDFNLAYRNLNVFGGWISGSDQESHMDTVHTEGYTLFFGELDYMVYPWLIGILRYEQANPDDLNPVQRLVPSLTVLYTANIKFIVESPVTLSDMNGVHLMMGLDFAF